MRLSRDCVHVSVPATSANLGPGFDCLGLALNLRDDIYVRATTGTSHVTIKGWGENSLPTGEDHLIVKTVRYVLDRLGLPQVGLELVCHNRIPHARGLGSSAAAIVAGITLVRGLIDYPQALDNDTVIQLGSYLEGHGDNVAPAVLGGATLVWERDGMVTDEPVYKARRIDVKSLSDVTICIAPYELSTQVARGLLPGSIGHDEAVKNSCHVGLMVYGLEHDSSVFFDATQDYLHQSYRREAMPGSLEVVDMLRERAKPAVISGAGPSVLVLGTLERDIVDTLEHMSWDIRQVQVAHEGANIISDSSRVGDM